MQPSRQLDIQSFLDTRPFGAFQWKILLLCLTVLVLDGFDVVIMGFIAPALIADWGIARESLGVVMSAGLFGLALGALGGGPLADRFGRRRVIIGAVFFFGVMSILSAWAPNLMVLSVLRFLTGLGLGASQPNAATLASEYAPRKYRSLMVTVVYCGFTLGAAGAGFLANAIMATHGWSAILLIGGIVPVLFAGVLCLILPESAKYLVVKKTRRPALERIANSIEPGIADSNTQFVTPERQNSGERSVNLILSRPHVVVTMALWVGLFMNLMTVYFLNSWLPIIVKDDGFSLADAALVGGMMQVGGTLGNIVIGWEMDRFKAHRVMIGTLLGAAILTVTLGLASPGLYGLMALVFMLGFCINSTNTGWTAMAAIYYPTEMRATGTSWMTGIGRFGAILGAYIGAVLLGLKWDFNNLFMILTVPIAIAVLAAFIKGRAGKGHPASAVQDMLDSKAAS
ncbi:aromatic acid/H+ symport family MFS transporter [Pseudomonas fluorescens]|nr:aromatic acid/H+ symport family MFS transporter [Pseudomonas fluorescens]MBD8094593.1 aromatic acid/H+ symport family MFS transporter [Pseudomonas fluorescens]MBD8720496.1 aromatic acid/H+ symport family MFS transporter [Pseudomonas fluorescens]